MKRSFLLAMIIISGMLSKPVYALPSDSLSIEMILERMQETLSNDPPPADEVKELLRSMQPDGSWKDVDYESTRISEWPVLKHLTVYVLPMVKAYSNKSSSFYKSKKLASAIHTSLDFWLTHNFTSQNWWYNDIGIPNTLTDILVLFKAEITPRELLEALNQMRGSYIDQTGQNKVWRAEIQLKIGLLEYGRGRMNILGNPIQRIREAADILKQELVVTAEDGIQPDWSFHQHGVQQQFGNYGLSFASTQVRWARLLMGTPFQYPEGKILLLRSYLCNGLAAVVWKGTMDISACGRQLFPNSPENKGDAVIKILKEMIGVDRGHASVYQAILENNTPDDDQQAALTGNTYFWRSDLMVNRTGDSYISVRLHSNTIQGTESINGENLLGVHLADGATYVYSTGKEYQNIFPVWDWHDVPGGTSYSQGKLQNTSWGGWPNENDFAGGVSDSTFGAAAMLYEQHGLSAHKSWFFLPGGVVCLGAGIRGDSNARIATTVNQCLLQGEVNIKTGGQLKNVGQGVEMNNEPVDDVYHDSVGYLFLQKEQVSLSTMPQKGSWRKIYHQGSDSTITKNVFKLYIDHGADKRSESYSYMILPGISRDSLAYFSKYLPVIILRNDTLVQGIRYPSKDLTEMVFYHPSQIKMDKETMISVNGACLLIVRKFRNGLKLTMSVPPALQNKIVLHVSGHFNCPQCEYNKPRNQTNVDFHLPDGIYEGKSVSLSLKPVP